MKHSLLLAAICLIVIDHAFAQPNVFDPNDPVTNYNPASPPATPPSNTMAKWVRTVRGSITWNTEKFKPYYFNDMAFRLRYPNGYNPADQTKKYPVIVFFHGGGEIAPVTDNEFHLLWGAQLFENIVNAGQFNAFLLFPQQKTIGWEDSYFSRINHVLDSLQKYCNVDPDRVIPMGLSIGGNGAIYYSSLYPKRSATIIASSPSFIASLIGGQNSHIHIPLWVASGGIDPNPDQGSVQKFVDSLVSKGGDARWSFYSQLGHGVWTEQWNEPFLIPYWNSAHKANPLIFHANQVGTVAPINARLGITPGFFQYQWQKDNVDIPGATSHELTVTQFGTYRVRFKRSAASDWSAWSPQPAVLSATDVTPPSPPGNIKVLYTGRNFVHLDWENATDNRGVTAYDVFIDGVNMYRTHESSITAGNLAANTSYAFTVKAADQAGNTSSFSNLITQKTSSTVIGLNYRYYSGAWDALPNFNALTPVRTGLTANADITVRPEGVNDNFGFVWEGYLNITTPGTYTFETVSDDGSRLYFNSFYSPQASPLVNNDGLHGAIPSYGTVNVTNAGLYPVAITYFERGGGESMEIYWTGPGLARQRIPNSAFSNNPVSGLNYKYYQGVWTALPDFNSLTPLKSGATPNIDISVRNAGVNDNFSFLWEGYINILTPGNYTFETVSDDGSKFYFNSVYSSNQHPLINNDGLHAARSVPGTVNIASPGLYPIALSFFEASGGETIQLYYSGPGIPRQLVPNSVFTNNTSPPPPPANGLTYKYYHGTWNALPDFNTLSPVRTGSSPNIDISVRNSGVNDNFAFLWEGYINLPTAGSYTFETISDDGSKLYFNSFYSPSANPLVNNDGLHAPRSVSGTVAVPAPGTYPIAITFFEASGGETMQVYYSGPGIPRQLIPNAAFVGNPPHPVANGLNYKYYHGTWSALPDFNALVPVKTGSTPTPDIGVRNAGVNDNFAFLWEGYINISTPGDYTFETISDDGSKFYFNSFYSPGANALVNNDGLHPSRSVSGTVNIPAGGSYPVAITFFEASGGEVMQVYYSGPGIPRQLIPPGVFTQSNSSPPIVNLEAFTIENGASPGAGLNTRKENNLALQIHPNPFTNTFRISFYNSAVSDKINVGVYDITGRRLYHRYFGDLGVGNTNLRIDASQLLNGIYFVRIDVNGIPSKMIKLLKAPR